MENFIWVVFLTFQKILTYQFVYCLDFRENGNTVYLPSTTWCKKFMQVTSVSTIWSNAEHARQSRHVARSQSLVQNRKSLEISKGKFKNGLARALGRVFMGIFPNFIKGIFSSCTQTLFKGKFLILKANSNPLVRLWKSVALINFGFYTSMPY